MTPTPESAAGANAAAGSATAARRRFPLSLALACVAFLATRAAALFSDADAVSIPVFELATIGNLAKALSEGGGASLAAYYDNCGGHLMTGMLAAPLYAWLGDSYAVLKIVPIALGVAAMLVMWSLLARHESRTAANLAAWFFALAPPTLFKYALLAKGNHFENLAFQLAMLAAWAIAVASSRRTAWLALFGLVAGVAISVYFGALLLLAAIAISHVGLRGWREALRDLRPILPGFALGLSPIAWIELTAERGAIAFVDAKVGGAAHAVSAGKRLGELFTAHLPRATVFEDLGSIPGAVADWTYFAVFAVAWIALAARWLRGRSRERWKRAPFVLYLPLFALAFAFSNFDFDRYAPPVEIAQYRYLVPHFALACCIVAIVAAEWIAAGGARRWAGFALALAMLATSAFTLPIVDWSFERRDHALRYPGHEASYYAKVALVGDPPLAIPPERWLAQPSLANLDGLPPWFCAQAIEGFGHHEAQIVHYVQGRIDVAALLADLERRYPSEVLPSLARGVGCYLRSWSDGSQARAVLTATLLELDRADPWLARFVIEGMAIPYGFVRESNSRYELERSADVVAVTPQRLRPAIARGRGLQAGRLLSRGILAERLRVAAIAEALEPVDREPFWCGLGFGLADGRDEPRLGAALLAYVPAEHRRALLAGFGAALRGCYGAEQRARWWQTIGSQLARPDSEAFQEGLRWDAYPRWFEL